MSVTCDLCGRRRRITAGNGGMLSNLRTFADGSVVCEDATACLGRRAGKLPAGTAKSRQSYKERKLQALRGPPRARERHELPSEIAKHARAQTRLEKDLAKPDRRAACPVHGPKTVQAGRFVCCGRVHEVAAKVQKW